MDIMVQVKKFSYLIAALSHFFAVKIRTPLEWMDQNLLLFSCMNSVPAIYVFSNSVIELFRDTCTENFWKKLLWDSFPKKIERLDSKKQGYHVTVLEKRITTDFIPEWISQNFIEDEYDYDRIAPSKKYK